MLITSANSDLTSQDVVSLEVVNAGVDQALKVIWHLQHIASLLLVYRNASPAFLINKLPNEILAMVFCEASWKDPAAMFAISQTCARWRRLALHTPEMWSVVELRKWEHNGSWAPNFQYLPATMNTVLTRQIMQRSSPLGVRMTIPCDARGRDDHSKSNHIPSLILTQDFLPRLVELDISTRVDYVGQMSWLENNPAPVLQKLSIKARQHPTRAHGPQVLRSIFAGKTPNLESIRLSGLRVAWDSAAFPSKLKMLTIDEKFGLWGNPGYRDGFPWPEHPRYTSDHSVISVLQSCPELEVLSLRRCSNLRCGYSDGNHIPLVQVPRLRKLLLQNAIVDSVHVLSALSSLVAVPSLQVRCDVKSHALDEPLPRLSHLPTSVFDVLASVSSIIVSATAVRASRNAIDHNGLDNADVTIDLYCHSLEDTFSLLESSTQDSTVVDNIFTELIPYLPLVHIRHLKLMYTPTRKRKPIQCSTVVDVINSLPNLQHLALENFTSHSNADEDIAHLWEALTSACRRYPGMLLQQLQSVHVKGCYLSCVAFVDFICNRLFLPEFRSLEVVHVTFDVMNDTTEEAVRGAVPHVVWKDVQTFR